MVFLPDNGLPDSKINIHGGSRSNPVIKAAFLVDYCDPKQSANEKIKEPVSRSIEVVADGDNKRVETREFSACHESVDSQKSSYRDVTQIALMGTFNFDEKLRALKENENREEDDMIGREIKNMKKKKKENSDRFNFWKRNLNAVGGISFDFFCCCYGFYTYIGKSTKKKTDTR